MTAIAVGLLHACAITSGGGVKCWGSNDYGQLGDNGVETYIGNPVNVSGLTSGVTAIAAGSMHTCAITEAGAVKCWGYNMLGQLGDNTSSNRLTPVTVSGLSSGATAISTGNDHTCALLSGGAVRCWGSNDFGTLGDTSVPNILSIFDVSGLTGIGLIEKIFSL